MVPPVQTNRIKPLNVLMTFTLLTVSVRSFFICNKKRRREKKRERAQNQEKFLILVITHFSNLVYGSRYFPVYFQVQNSKLITIIGYKYAHWARIYKMKRIPHLPRSYMATSLGDCERFQSRTDPEKLLPQRKDDNRSVALPRRSNRRRCKGRGLDRYYT